MTTAFVLSGGASHGSVQVGMAIALEQRGIRPDLIVGTSVGAINGAWLAGGGPAAGLADVWLGLRRADLFPLHPLLGLRAFAGKSTHFVPDVALRATLSRHLPFEMIEDALTPLIIVAADALSGEEVLLTAGNAVDAVTASASLPAVYPPRLGQCQRSRPTARRRCDREQHRNHHCDQCRCYRYLGAVDWLFMRPHRAARDCSCSSASRSELDGAASICARDGCQHLRRTYSPHPTHRARSWFRPSISRNQLN